MVKQSPLIHTPPMFFSFGGRGGNPFGNTTAENNLFSLREQSACDDKGALSITNKPELRARPVSQDTEGRSHTATWRVF